MSKFSAAEHQFLALYRLGVWQKPIDESIFNNQVKWKEILEIAKKQTNIGVLLNSLQYLSGNYAQQEVVAKHIGLVLKIQQSNERMNSFLPKLFYFLQKNGINAWLLKGQGVARHYVTPLLRQSGDIDLYIPNAEEYKRTHALLIKRCNVIRGDVSNTGESIFSYKGIIIELHAKIVANISTTTSKKSTQWVEHMWQIPPILWKLNEQNVVLPPIRFDALYIFIHLARHYFGSCVGLRQITDWMCFLVNNQDKINQQQLLTDIDQLGLTRVWRIFATMAVDLLGCPVQAMPLYNQKYHKQACKLLRYILDSGNFGMHDKRIHTESSNLFVQKIVAMIGHLHMKGRNFSMFPIESIYSIPHFFKDGFSRFLKR